MFTGDFYFQGIDKFQCVYSIIKLEIIEVNLNKQLKGFFDEDFAILGLKFDAVLKVEYGLWFSSKFKITDTEIIMGLRAKIIVFKFFQ